MSHPLLNAFWMIFWFFIWIMWFMMLFRVIADLFSDKTMSGWVKVGWAVLVCLLPFLGVFIYLIVRGHSMGERAEAQVKQSQQEFDDYIRKTAGGSGGSGSGTADQLTKLADLKSSGAISDTEFDQAKQKILAS